MSFVKVRPKSKNSRRSEAPARFYVSEVDLLCRNSCGFYGNPEWGGYCSKCREASNFGKSRAKPLEIFEKTRNKVSRSVSDVGESVKTTLQSAKSTLPNLPRIDERRKLSSPSFPGKSGASKLFKKSPTKDGVRSLSPESRRVSDELSSCLKRHSSAVENETLNFAAKALVKVDQALADEHLHGEELSNLFKEVYQTFKDKADRDHVFRALNSEDIEQILDYLEKYLCTRLYRKLTYNGFSVEEDKDLQLQTRIRKMNWITAQILDCNINEKIESVQKALEEAISNLIELDAKRVPQDKLDLIVKTCNLAFKMLGESADAGDNAGSADDLLPTLIYIVLRANPPRLWSNITYITHFANPSRSESGESGYYFTNLRIAIEFIEKMSGKDLDLSEEQFNSYMSGELFPLSALQNGRYQPEGLQVMYSNLQTLAELQKKHDDLIEKASLIDSELVDFDDEISGEVDKILSQYPLNLRGPKIDFSLDDPTPMIDLPPPLVPIVVGPKPPALSEADEAFFVGGKKIPVIPCEAQTPSEAAVDAFGMDLLDTVLPTLK